MAQRNTVLDELPWLKPTPRQRRRAWLRAHGHSLVVLAGMAGALLLTVDFGVTGALASKTPGPPRNPASPVIEAPFAPEAMRPLSPDEAVRWNAGIPVAATAVAPAAPFSVGAFQGNAFSRSLDCLTAAVFYEAANEPGEGQRAVAQVVLNRVRHPAYPKSVCGVVFQGSERKTGCQFTFTCDGSLNRKPSEDGWRRASAVAAAALAGYVYRPVGWATHYHADYVVPYWAPSLEKLGTIGRHIFYRWGGTGGSDSAFSGRYAGVEPDVPLAGVALAADTAAIGLADAGPVHITAGERPIIEREGAPGAGATSAAETGGSAIRAASASAGESATAAADTGSRWIIR